VERALEVEVDELFLHRGEGHEGETYEIAGETIDLVPLVRDAIVLALPMNPLCRADCKGLCPVCGADRNRVDCGHTGERVDIRWGPLAGLREQMEE